MVWAKSEEHGGKIKGFIIDKGAKVLAAPKIESKFSLRAPIMMDEVFVPDENILPTFWGRCVWGL